MTIIPPSLALLLEQLQAYGIKPILVGGYVRDTLLEIQSNDIDIELYGVHDLTLLEKILEKFGKVNLVGKSFGVFKLSFENYSLDFSPPRTESKSGFGHKGFEIHWESHLDFKTASRRRDFTINAIGYDPLIHEFLDPHGGIEDLRRKVLRYVDANTFADDPLRVLRAVQFAARFELTCNNNLLELCRTMVHEGALQELPKERIFEELKKLLLSATPSIGFKLMNTLGMLSFFSELSPLLTTMQDPLSHPEGSVWTHTLMALDVMASMKTGETSRDLILMLAMLLHDIGKPLTTDPHTLNAPHHANAGVDLARTFITRISNDTSLIPAIIPLIRYHGMPRKLFQTKEDSEILHLSTEVCIEDLILIARADFFGRNFNGEIPAVFEAGEWLYARASALGVLHNPPKPLLMGRDLIALGLTPSIGFKSILNEGYKAQLDQKFDTHDSALQWLKDHLVTVL